MIRPLLIALLVLVVVIVLALRHFNELFLLRQRAGKLTLIRGRIPPRLLTDLGDVLRLAQIHEAQVQGVVEDGRLRVRLRGVSPTPAVEQRLRNVAALWPLAKIRNTARR